MFIFLTQWIETEALKRIFLASEIIQKHHRDTFPNNSRRKMLKITRNIPLATMKTASDNINHRCWMQPNLKHLQGYGHVWVSPTWVGLHVVYMLADGCRQQFVDYECKETSLSTQKQARHSTLHTTLHCGCHEDCGRTIGRATLLESVQWVSKFSCELLPSASSCPERNVQ